MRSHINKLSWFCFYSMWPIRAIMWCLTTEAANTLVSSFVCSKIDYCNTVFVSLLVSTTDCLNDVLHAAAWLISGHHKCNHITLVLRDQLHWLSMHQHIQYKLAALQPCVPVLSLTSHSWLCSADSGTLSFIQPNRGSLFMQVQPSAWNNLPIAFKGSSTICAFRSELKTYLFWVGYSTLS